MAVVTKLDDAGRDVELARRALPPVGADPTLDVERDLALAPVSVGGLVLRFALAGLVALVLVAVVMAYASRNVGTDRAIADARRVTWVSARGIVEPVLDDGVLRRDRATLDRLDAAVREGVLQGSLVRVKLWAADGTIVYSDESRLIGERFDLGDDERAVFDGAEAEAHVSDLSRPENRFETETKLLEVYQLTATQEGTPLLFEAYFRYSGVTAVGRDLWGRFAPIAIASLVILELIQIPFAWSLARRLRAVQQQRERLLRHAIEASDAERRRVASDLHDGVVQELTGVSIGLAAAARRGPDADPAMAEASASIRESIKSLRSLLVDIYPPNLHQEGLESAITDLLTRLTNRGLATHLDANLGGTVLPPETAGLLYRAAQEALRNIAAHAHATAVRVALDASAHEVRLVIDDDGHVGLRALAGLVADAGGKATVRSSPGTGTRLEVVLPLAGGGPA